MKVSVAKSSGPEACVLPDFLQRSPKSLARVQFIEVMLRSKSSPKAGRAMQSPFIGVGP